MSKTKFEQFWIRQKATHYDGFTSWQVFKEGIWLENEDAVSNFIHVIEYSAYEQLEKDNKELRERLVKYEQQALAELNKGSK
jgi:cell division septum initiation protein DivIVA